MKEQISLYFKKGPSDKFYIIGIEEKDDGFIVPFTYGRTGTSGKSGFKTKVPETYEKAKKIYDGVVRQKMGKGYKPDSESDGETHAGITVEKIDTGIYPQLLCPIEDDEVELFLKDCRYGAQEKKDGVRKFMQRKSDGTNVSINRKGQEVGYPACFNESCSLLTDKPFIVDGEGVDQILHVFDILEMDGKDFRNLPYIKRYEILASLNIERAFSLVPLVVTEREKRELYERLQKEKKEGIIFKLLDAPYTVGRSSEDYVTYAQNCPQVKSKFYATASCIVIRINKKRSIGLGLYDGTELIDHGNCTIPPNKEIPEIESVVEIRMLYCFKGGKIYQPTYIGPRDDIDKKECVVSKLKYKPE